MRAARETLVEGGVSEEVAYYSCVQELKQILDLVHAEGVAGMRARTSRTAQYGGLTRGPRIVGDAARAEMRRVLEEIRGGSFAEEWLRETRSGGADLDGRVAEEAGHPLESAGERVRRGLGPSR
jgi:ketol-acid reductoisomerase